MEDLLISVLWLSLTILMVAVIIDIRSLEIPDWIPACLLALACCATGFGFHKVGWLDLLAGAAIGFVAGTFLFWLGGFGGGDVKLLSSLGAVLGWRNGLAAMFWIALAGGVLAIVAGLRRQKEFAYAPAIALGLFAFIVRGYFP